MPTPGNAIAYRAAELSDLSFVVSGWSSSYKQSRQAGMIYTDDWADVMHAAIKRQLARPTVRSVVAHAVDDPDFLYGFAVVDTSWRRPIVFYVFVKETYRRAGYAKGLLAEAGIKHGQRFDYPCWTPILHVLADKIPLAKHNANLARYASYDPPKKEIQIWKR